MLSERPVVASAVSSIPEIVVDGETGRLVRPDDPPALAAAVTDLLDHPARAAAMGAAGLELARAEFSVERMAERTAGVYERGALPSPLGLQVAQVESLDALRRALLREGLERTPATGLAHRGGTRQVGRDSHHRVGERLRVAGRDDEARLAVGDDLGQAADVARDHRPAALHRLQRDHAEALAERRDDDGSRGLDRALDRRDEPQEANRLREAELVRVRLERGLERPLSRDVEHEVGDAAAGLRERAQEDEMALDRISRPTQRSRGRSPVYGATPSRPAIP